MSKKLAIGRILGILGGGIVIAAFFFGTYVINRNAQKFEYYSPGEHIVKSRAPYERMMDIAAECSLCALPHIFGLLIVLTCVWFIWKKEKGDRLAYLVYYIFTGVTFAVILHNVAVGEIITPSVYRAFFWSAFPIAAILVILFYLGIDMLSKSNYISVLATQLTLGLTGLGFFIFHFFEFKGLIVRPDAQPLGQYFALAGYLFIISGAISLYLAELDRKQLEQKMAVPAPVLDQEIKLDATVDEQPLAPAPETPVEPPPEEPPQEGLSAEQADMPAEQTLPLADETIVPADQTVVPADQTVVAIEEEVSQGESPGESPEETLPGTPA